MEKNKNLTSWEKGQSGNLNGRPKGARNRQAIVKEMVERAALSAFDGKMADVFKGKLPKGFTVADQMTAIMVARAMNGDVSAYRELMDAGYGKLTDKLDNLHSFSAMGRVTATLPAGEDIEGKEEVALSFDIGSDPLHDKQDN